MADGNLEASSRIGWVPPGGVSDDVPREARGGPVALRLRIADDGRELDPLGAAPPPLDPPAEDRPVGGPGIRLLRNMADEIEYRRAEGRSILTLVFSRDPKNRRFPCR
jgi:anti-sigma regulatory factor (Ser/Thr protein kinase)